MCAFVYNNAHWDIIVNIQESFYSWHFLSKILYLQCHMYDLILPIMPLSFYSIVIIHSILAIVDLFTLDVAFGIRNLSRCKAQTSDLNKVKHKRKFILLHINTTRRAGMQQRLRNYQNKGYEHCKAFFFALYLQILPHSDECTRLTYYCNWMQLQ